MIFVELEKLLKKNGWYYYGEGKFHIQYKHKQKKQYLLYQNIGQKLKKEF